MNMLQTIISFSCQYAFVMFPKTKCFGFFVFLFATEDNTIENIKNSLRACLEVLAGVQLLLYPWRKNGLPLSGKVVALDRAHSFRRDIHGAVREEEDNCLARKISQINPSDQWGVRCHSQVSLTTKNGLYLMPGANS